MKLCCIIITWVWKACFLCVRGRGSLENEVIHYVNNHFCKHLEVKHTTSTRKQNLRKEEEIVEPSLGKNLDYFRGLRDTNYYV